MITSNGKIILSTIINSVSSLPKNSIINYDDTTNSTSPTGTSLLNIFKSSNIKEYNYFDDVVISGGTSTYYGMFMILSSSEDSPTISDIDLDPIKNLNVDSVFSSSSSSSTEIYSTSKKVTNQTSNNIIVNSVGLGCYYISSSTIQINALIYHEKLEEPIILEPLDTYIFTVILR